MSLCHSACGTFSSVPLFQKKYAVVCTVGRDEGAAAPRGRGAARRPRGSSAGGCGSAAAGPPSAGSRGAPPPGRWTPSRPATCCPTAAEEQRKEQTRNSTEQDVGELKSSKKSFSERGLVERRIDIEFRGHRRRETHQMKATW